MNYQYYDTLYDKSDDFLRELLKRITPGFTAGEISVILNDLAGENDKISKERYYELTGEFGNNENLSKLNHAQLELLYKIFISKELNDRKAIKWRLYKYLKYTKKMNIESIKLDLESNDIDFGVQDKDDKIIFITCCDTLDLSLYMETINNIITYGTVSNIEPDRVIIATNKTFRNIPINEAFNLKQKTIYPELWVEYMDPEKNFNGEDLIIVMLNDVEQFKIAGFNFGDIQDLLDYIYKMSDGGQIAIFRQIGYFSEVVKEQEQVIELIWKGIMIKT